MFFGHIVLSFLTDLNFVRMKHVVLVILDHALRSHRPWRYANSILLQANYAVLLWTLKPSSDHFSNTWLLVARSALAWSEALLCIILLFFWFLFIEELPAEFVSTEQLVEGGGILEVEVKELTVEGWAVESRHVGHSGPLKWSQSIVDQTFGTRFKLLALLVGLL